MSDPMAEIRASFFVECDELLESLQDGLQAMSEGSEDGETINIVFRAVHSIKGGAGAFGLDDLVAFAHIFETALDEVRAGRLTAGNTEMRLFFSSGDILGDLVQAARDGEALDDAKVAPLRHQLSDLVGEEPDTAGSPSAEAPSFTPMAIDLDFDFEDESAAGTDAKDVPPQGYDITFIPTPELFSSGNEPVFLLRGLSDLGPVDITCHCDGLTGLDGLDATEPKIWWSIRLSFDGPETEIREVFEFVEGLCTLEIHQGSVQLPTLSDSRSRTPASGPEPLVEPPIQPGADAQLDAEGSPAPAPRPAVEMENRTASAPAAKPKATVRVDLDRIDRLVNLVGELVINQAMLSQSIGSAGLASNSTVATGLDEFLQLTRNIQESVMMIRAQPVKSLFQRMARIVRESSAAVGKDVRFTTDGETTEIDKTVIERLADPLTHMIRNAVDHGLEATDDRLAAGKPGTGQIVLSAAHRSGRVVIEIADDGAGIDRPRVKQIAEDKGLIARDQPLSESEIDNLLFLPGFSTAKEVSNLSGRGVGMDVVRNAITSLGGRITISSEPGKGTTFSISLPLTLAVLDGMVVRVAEETLVVPLSAIAETLSLQETDLNQLAPGRHLVQVREQFVPLLDLGAALGYREPLADYVGSIVLLLSNEDGTQAALIVDAIEDQRQVVIKGLQESYGHVPGVAAATILGDGQIALILDPSDLTSGATRRDTFPDKLKEVV